MRKWVGVPSALIAAIVMLVMASPVAAITKNYVEDFEHPYVGLIAFYVEDGAIEETGDGEPIFDGEPDFSHRCSGSLLSPTVFLTAGHCTWEPEDADPDADLIFARVWFQQDAGANYDPETELDTVSGYPEYCAENTLGVTCATSDEFYAYEVYDDFTGWPVDRDTGDVGIVILDQAIALGESGQLAEPGTLDGLQQARGIKDTTFTVSGYGVTYTSPVHFESYRSRLMATSTLVNLKGLSGGFNLQTVGNGAGLGGTCGGDSGGPVFLGGTESNLIVGVTSYGLNAWCRGTDFAYRTDTEDVYSWITSFLD